MGRLCEIAPVTRAAELMGLDGYTVWRLDFRRMKQMLQSYKIPKAKRISVDEVHARRRSKYFRGTREDEFFTVISDLETRKVIWVSESRSQKALDEFFQIIGEAASKDIEVVAIDQHDAYLTSVKRHCPRAVVVWDRFHIMQNFEEAVNETRKQIASYLDYGSSSSELKRLTRGKFKYLFLKKASRRTEEEKEHIDTVMKLNNDFIKLELIKERMLTLFDEPTSGSARDVFEEIGRWIDEAGFSLLQKWWNSLNRYWNIFSNYFEFRVTTALSEGINNVIKALKRRGFGYRNLQYFKLKIMQVCGYLNSKFIHQDYQMLTQI